MFIDKEKADAWVRARRDAKREKISEAMLKLSTNPEYRKGMSERASKMTPETRAKIYAKTWGNPEHRKMMDEVAQERKRTAKYSRKKTIGPVERGKRISEAKSKQFASNPELKKRMSEIAKAQQDAFRANPGTRKKRANRLSPEEAKARLEERERIALLKHNERYRNDPEYREKRLKRGSEERAKKRLEKTGTTELNRERSQEQRAKIAASLRGRNQPPETNAKRSKSLRKWNNKKTAADSPGISLLLDIYHETRGEDPSVY